MRLSVTDSSAPGPGAASTSASALACAACMRFHGITDFPDSMSGGGFDIPGNTDTPQFRSAEAACGATFGSAAAHPGENGGSS